MDVISPVCFVPSTRLQTPLQRFFLGCCVWSPRPPGWTLDSVPAEQVELLHHSSSHRLKNQNHRMKEAAKLQ